MSTFDTTKIRLPILINDIVAGGLQLPDFQRGWVWDDSHVRSLLVSIARSFPVGAVMLLETGGAVNFQVRPIENVSFQGAPPPPAKLILDGQQRLTSLTQVLALQTPVKTFNTKGRAIERYYYIDIQKALDPDRIDESFFSVEADRKLKKNFGQDVELDLSTRLLECQNLCFPCNQILNANKWEKELHRLTKEHAVPQAHFDLYMEFREQVVDAFTGYDMPIISLGKATSKEAVCLVFEKVNTGGVPLSVFELVTASFAAENFNLRDDWFGSAARGVKGREATFRSKPILTGTPPTDFLQAVALLYSLDRRQADLAAGKLGKSASAVSAKRTTILSLGCADYQRWAGTVEKGFLAAAMFLRMEHFFSARDLPYRPQIVPLATVLAIVGERWLEPKIREKLSRWFWCGVLGELYGGAVETRIANDVEDLLGWIDGGGPEPRTVYESAFQANRLATLRSRGSAAYKGLHVLVQREGSEDFFWKARIHELEHEEWAIDIHHIFPRKWCIDRGISRGQYDSIVNKTPISLKANRKIGGNAPSVYLKSLQAHAQVQASDEQMNAVLATHLIDAAALRADDFQKFCELRSAAMLALVERVTGKATAPSFKDSSNSQDDFEAEEDSDQVTTAGLEPGSAQPEALS